MALQATKATVTSYLVAYYIIDHADAVAAVERHADLIADAERLGSFAYYPGDKIADLEKLEPRDVPESDEEEDAPTD